MKRGVIRIGKNMMKMRMIVMKGISNTSMVISRILKWAIESLSKIRMFI